MVRLREIKKEFEKAKLTRWRWTLYGVGVIIQFIRMNIRVRLNGQCRFEHRRRIRYVHHTALVLVRSKRQVRIVRSGFVFG